MFNRFGQPRPFTPSTPQRPLPGQSPTVSSGSTPNSYGSQIKPDFMQPSSPTGDGQSGFSRPSRVKQDAFSQTAPQSQRSALYEQARQQMTQSRYQNPRNLSTALPGGLSEKQRMDFKMLERSNPAAAEKQLLSYQNTSDIRYNKPQIGPAAQPPAGPTYHRPPTSFNGPRGRFTG